MSTLKEYVNRAVIALHRETGKEWIPLKDIYRKVEELRNKPNANEGASIRAVLEIHCASSDVFSGNELYLLKEKGSGLYKFIDYDRLKFIDGLTIGDIFTRDQLMNIFKVSGQSGMMKTNSLDCLVLTTSESNGIYDDSMIENGSIQYTGEGKIGDQSITVNNKTLYNSLEEKLPVYLFSKDSDRKYVFEGRVKLYDTPYQIEENDVNGNNRLVWKFPLQVIYSNDYDYNNNPKFKELKLKIENIDNNYEIEEQDFEIVLKEEPLHIRKYNEKEEKIKRDRKSKPDYLAEQIVKSKQGIINEKVVFEYEIKRLMELDLKEEIDKMNEFFNNKKENEGYDILSFDIDSDGNIKEKYIEVKSTLSDESTPIEITDDELYFAKLHKENYYIYRIVNSNSNRYVKIITGNELFTNYKLVPVKYKIYGN